MNKFLQIPDIETPFFKESIEDLDISLGQYNQLMNFHKNGYLIIENVLTQSECKQIITDIAAKIEKETFKKQDSRYEYSDSPRIFEAWKDTQSVLDLARNEKVLNILKLIYGRQPLPFQTINFKKGTNQPLHSDAIHFHTVPERWMVGSWTALEDVDMSNGSLAYVPGSHKWPFYSLSDIGEKVPIEYGNQFEAYANYEEFLRNLVEAKGANIESLAMNAGSTIIWAANLLHGGTPYANTESTRWSQATHYYFPGCKKYYCPLYSDIPNGIYSEKDLSQKDILNHAINNI